MTFQGRCKISHGKCAPPHTSPQNPTMLTMPFTYQMNIFCILFFLFLFLSFVFFHFLIFLRFFLFFLRSFFLFSLVVIKETQVIPTKQYYCNLNEIAETQEPLFYFMKDSNKWRTIIGGRRKKDHPPSTFS